MDIDRARMIFTKMKVGPCGLMDSIGRDVVYDREAFYANDSKDPKDILLKAFRDKLEKGALAVKSGKGFYAYPNPEFMVTDF